MGVLFSFLRLRHETPLDMLAAHLIICILLGTKRCGLILWAPLTGGCQSLGSNEQENILQCFINGQGFSWVFFLYSGMFYCVVLCKSKPLERMKTSLNVKFWQRMCARQNVWVRLGSEPGMVVHTSNSSTWEAGVGRSQVWAA